MNKIPDLLSNRDLYKGQSKRLPQVDSQEIFLIRGDFYCFFIKSNTILVNSLHTPAFHISIVLFRVYPING